MEFEITSTGLSDFTVRMRAVANYRDDLRELVKSAGTQSADYMRRSAPFQSGDIQRAIYISEPTYSPGGAGGGGYYEVEVGIDRDIAPHVDYVLQGTGMFKGGGNNAGGLIYSRSGGPMVFSKRGEGQIFTMNTTGQMPNRAWYDNAQDVAREIIRNGIHRLGERRIS